MIRYNRGDKVRISRGIKCESNGQEGCSSMNISGNGIIEEWYSDGTYDIEMIYGEYTISWEATSDFIEKFVKIQRKVYESDIVELLKTNVKNITNMNIKEKFALALTKEPMKTFRKVGITNGDDLLTDDGMKVFLSWLLNKKFADEFKAEVVDDMLKEIENEKE